MFLKLTNSFDKKKNSCSFYVISCFPHLSKSTSEARIWKCSQNVFFLGWDLTEKSLECNDEVNKVNILYAIDLLRFNKGKYDSNSVSEFLYVDDHVVMKNSAGHILFIFKISSRAAKTSSIAACGPRTAVWWSLI